MARAAVRVRRVFLLSGHCHPGNPATSHERCHLVYAGGQAANPDKEWQWCPCSCHLAKDEDDNVEVYDCACGGKIAEAPLMGLDEDGDPYYVHLDPADNRMVSLECRE